MNLKTSTKLSLTFFLITLTFLFDWQLRFILFGLLLLIALVTPSTFFLRNSKIRIYKVFTYGIVFTLILFIINGILMKSGKILFAPLGISIYEDGIIFSLAASSRLLLIITILLIFFSTTSIRAISDFIRRLGFPHQLSLILLLSLYYIESLPLRIHQIYTAQEARGAPVRESFFLRFRAFFPLLLPLILSSLVEVVDRGVALELRGVHLSGKVLQDEKQRITLTSLFISLMTILLIVYLIFI